MAKNDIPNNSKGNARIALLAQKAITKFLTKNSSDDLGIVLNTTEVTHLDHAVGKISLESLESRQHFYTSALSYSSGSKKVINTLVNGKYDNFNITDVFWTQKDFEKDINIEPFKDLRKKVKKGTADFREIKLLALCEKYKMVFGIRKNVYLTNKEGDALYKDGEKQLKVKGGAAIIAISHPTMAISSFEYDEIVMITPDVTKKYWGMQTLTFLNNQDETKDARKMVKNLLNYMENADISDLHMGQSDDESYFITARQHTKIIPIKDENNESIQYPTARAMNIINMLIRMGNKDTESKSFAKNAILSEDLDNGRRGFRLNVLSTVNSNERGHSFSLRRLSKEDELKSPEDLNYMRIAIDAIIYLLQSEDGLIIISGKTNSGKTTLLTAMLKILRDDLERRITRMGNPIEIPLDNTIMVDVSHYGSDENKEIGSDGSIVEYILGQFLRHDPDVTVAEEVRYDHERKVALDLAERGHLTLLSSHAKNIELSIKAFLDMKGVTMSYLNSLMKGCINQKLILKPCKCTRSPEILPADCDICGGSEASGVLPVYDIVVYTNLGMDDNILDTQKILNEGKGFGITKEDCLNFYKKTGILKADSDIIYVGDNDDISLEAFVKGFEDQKRAETSFSVYDSVKYEEKVNVH